jgi:hypothetical protein
MKSFLERVLDILSPAAPPRPSYDDNDSSGGFSISLSDLNATEVAATEATFNSDEFVKLYGEYMQEHYGRPAQFTTDLFCCMLPIAVEITAGQVQTLHRYWWIPAHHPVTGLLLFHSVPNCGEVDAGICGSCIIYPDSYVVEWVERILGYFKDAHIELIQPPLKKNGATAAAAAVVGGENNEKRTV